MDAHHSHSIKAIIFDLGNVIVLFDHFTICNKLSVFSPYSPEEIYDGIFTSGLEAQFDTGTLSPEGFFKEACSALHLTIELDLFRKIWNNIFSLNTDVENLILQLKGKYRLLCLSNTNTWQFEYCRKHFPVLDNFDSFVLSFQEGLRKPDWKIYEKALQVADARPEECVYIDDREEFVQTAEALGMDAILFVSTKDLASKLRRHLS